MKRPASRCLNDRGLDETVSVILMVILVIAVAAIIASIVFGLAIFFPKSAYIAVQTEAKNVSPDNWYLSVSHMNGDAAYLNHTLATNEGMPVDFQFTNATLGTVIAKPDPADGSETWKPGDILFVYNKMVNGNQSIWVTKNETVARSGIGLPQGHGGSMSLTRLTMCLFILKMSGWVCQHRKTSIRSNRLLVQEVLSHLRDQ